MQKLSFFIVRKTLIRMYTQLLCNHNEGNIINEFLFNETISISLVKY